MSPPRPGGANASGPAASPDPGPAAAARRPSSSRPASARLGGGSADRAQPRVWRGLFFAVAIAAIVAGAVWAVLGSRFLVVRSVRVFGAGGLVTASQVRAAARVPVGLPMLRVSDAQIARRVERIRQVQSAQVSRDWPNTVVIAVRPRTPVFAVRAQGSYQLVDRFGVSVAESARRPRELPLLTVGRPGATAPLANNPAVRAAADVLRELPAGLARRVRSVSAVNASDVSVRLGGKVEIIWGGVGRPAEKARELAALMRTHARVYDVSAPATAVTGG